MRKIVLAAMLTVTAQAQAPMPPNTIPLSAMMEQLSSKPGFTEAFLKQIEGQKGGHKQGAALLTPDLIHELRKVILGKDWQRLDHFPAGPWARSIPPFASSGTRSATTRKSTPPPQPAERPPALPTPNPATKQPTHRIPHSRPLQVRPACLDRSP